MESRKFDVRQVIFFATCTLIISLVLPPSFWASPMMPSAPITPPTTQSQGSESSPVLPKVEESKDSQGNMILSSAAIIRGIPLVVTSKVTYEPIDLSRGYVAGYMSAFNIPTILSKRGAGLPEDVPQKLLDYMISNKKSEIWRQAFLVGFKQGGGISDTFSIRK